MVFFLLVVICVFFLYLLSFARFSFRPLFFLPALVCFNGMGETYLYLCSGLRRLSDGSALEVQQWCVIITFIKRLQQLLQQPSSQKIGSLQFAICSLSRIAMSRSSSFNVQAKRVRTSFRTLTWLYVQAKRVRTGFRTLTWLYLLVSCQNFILWIRKKRPAKQKRHKILSAFFSSR